MAQQDLVGGLFGLSPYQIQQQQYAKDEDFAYKQANMNAAQRGVQGLMMGGAGLARLGAGLMGMQNPAVEEARQQQEAMKGVNFQNPETMRLRANEIRATNPQIAARLDAAANEVEKRLAETGKLYSETLENQAQTRAAFMTPEMKNINAIFSMPKGSPQRLALESQLKAEGLVVEDVGVEGRDGYIQKAIIDKRTGKTTPVGPIMKDTKGTRISVDTGGASLEKEIGPMLEKSMVKAEAGIQTLAAADRLERALSSGKVLTGPLADKALTVKQFFDRSGGDKSGVIANTRNAIQSLAQYNLLSREALRGQGQVTESEAAAAAKALGGDIESMTVAEIREVNSVIKKMAEYAIKGHKSRLEKARKLSPKAAQLVPMFEIGDVSDMEIEPKQPAAKPKFLGFE